MQPPVPFVVLLSCSVSFILLEKSLSVWTLTADLGLCFGVSVGKSLSLSLTYQVLRPADMSHFKQQRCFPVLHDQQAYQRRENEFFLGISPEELYTVLRTTYW